jgi:hypothetical protein
MRQLDPMNPRGTLQGWPASRPPDQQLAIANDDFYLLARHPGKGDDNE